MRAETVLLDDTNQISRVYRMKRIGPKTEPCGTPHTSAVTIDFIVED